MRLVHLRLILAIVNYMSKLADFVAQKLMAGISNKIPSSSTWRQKSSLVVWLTQESRRGRYLSLVHTYAVTQTVQIHRIIMTTERITDSRRIKNVQKINKENDKYVKVDM